MKKRTRQAAAAQGRPGRWTSDDLEAGRLQANQTARPWGVTKPTPDEVWAHRKSVTGEARDRFRGAAVYYEQQARQEEGYLPKIDLGSGVQAKLDRIAIPRALRACGYLQIRRRTIRPPIKSHKLA